MSCPTSIDINNAADITSKTITYTNLAKSEILSLSGNGDLPGAKIWLQNAGIVGDMIGSVGLLTEPDPVKQRDDAITMAAGIWGGAIVGGALGAVIGAGLDTMHGGAGADTFVFELASAFSNVDVIRDFSVGDDDVIDLTDILDTVYDPLSDAIADFVQFTESSGNTFVEVDRDGTGSTYSFAQIAKLEGVTNLASPELLETNGNLLAA